MLTLSMIRGILEHYFWFVATVLFVATGEGLLFLLSAGLKKPARDLHLFGPDARKLPAIMLRLISYSVGATFWIIVGYSLSKLFRGAK